MTIWSRSAKRCCKFVPLFDMKSVRASGHFSYSRFTFTYYFLPSPRWISAGEFAIL